MTAALPANELTANFLRVGGHFFEPRPTLYPRLNAERTIPISETTRVISPTVTRHLLTGIG